MNKLEFLLEKYKKQSIELGIALNPPATIEEIKTFEERVNIKLPFEIKEFYLTANGFETLDYLFRIIPLEEISEYKAELPSNRIYFAEYMIYSDTWEINISEDSYQIINNDHSSSADIIFSNSIFEFIDKYLDGNGIFGERGIFWQQEQFLNRE
ncbi:SMI1/KNR4 family protein [Taibaiella lutea]|uniref:SMI1/KNR4 family protein n=1 Tax=Taibaiella lutea TaxID=2608001 RepID=A0A5M6CPJ6_9BACT|nr:SMI1/KNR4 family protein [Taibaiella lutea]KAA5535049.1 SMI1/KNR4 family protein [Taibaiella lutea]